LGVREAGEMKGEIERGAIERDMVREGDRG